MKNKIALGLAALVALTNVKAGDREWATVGKVLTGVAALHVVERIVCPPQPQVVYVHQPVVVQSAPVVQYVPAPQVVYVPQPVYYYHVKTNYIKTHRNWVKKRIALPVIL